MTTFTMFGVFNSFLKHHFTMFGVFNSFLKHHFLTISVRQAAVAAQRTMTFQYDRPLERHS